MSEKRFKHSLQQKFEDAENSKLEVIKDSQADLIENIQSLIQKMNEKDTLQSYEEELKTLSFLLDKSNQVVLEGLSSMTNQIMEGSYKHIKNEKDALVEVNKKLSLKTNRYKDVVAQLKRLLKITLSDNSKLKSDNKKLETLSQNSTHQLQELKERFRRLTSRHEEKLSESERLKKEVSVLRSQLDGHKNYIFQLEKELDSLDSYEIYKSKDKLLETMKKFKNNSA